MPDLERVLAVSPHLDDAAFSAGAVIAHLILRGVDVHVFTFFAGLPRSGLSSIAQDFHRSCGLPDDASAVEHRRREDLAAISALGAQPHYGDLPEALYRRQVDGSWLCQHSRAIFDTRLASEPELGQEMEAALANLCDQLRPQLLLTCAGIGEHVDHRLTRTVTVGMAHTLDLRVRLWEDLPYGMKTPMGGQGAVATVASAAAWQRKWEAIGCYPTQTRMLWSDDTNWQQLFQQHAAMRGSPGLAELFWDTTDGLLPVMGDHGGS
ncbi:MAG: PIG-L deacetylase family protein [Egibacteraceae bacterium]